MNISTVRLTTAQTAARLKVKPSTLYAYVSRGFLVSERGESGGSTFDPIDVEAFAASRMKGAINVGVAGRPLMVLDSALTLIRDDELYFRGVPATQLAWRLSFEEAVRFLWSVPDAREDIDDRFLSRTDVLNAIRSASPNLGMDTRRIDRLKLALLIAGAKDPVRDVLVPSGVRDAGRHILATMVDSLPQLGIAPTPMAPLTTRLWSKLTTRVPSEGELKLLSAAMILCLDHDLAISTMAARVAASSRADPYGAVSAALNTMDGALHGGASVAAFEMVQEVMAGISPERAISTRLTKSSVIPGFGHLIYQEQDPRATMLFRLMRGLPDFRQAVDSADRIAGVILPRMPLIVNVDLALAVLASGAGMSASAAELIFAVSRTAGWVAHIIEEYAQPPMRLRPESRYVGHIPC